VNARFCAGIQGSEVNLINGYISDEYTGVPSNLLRIVFAFPVMIGGDQVMLGS